MSDSAHEQTTPPEPTTRAGFVAIIGQPNVGKSTFLNRALGVKLSIVTRKPQTTRKRVLGIHTDDDAQMVFLDTPGILDPKYELHRSMMGYVEESLESADVVVAMLDATRMESELAFFEATMAPMLARHGAPVVVVLNKVDLLHDKRPLLPAIASLTARPAVRECIPVSVLADNGVGRVLAAVRALLPAHEYYYDPELLSEQPERFFVSELIREVVFTEFRDEIPYSTEVQVMEFKEREAGKWFIAADIVVERDSQKGILIGKGGAKLKQVGARARAAIEQHLDVPVFLELYVKVRADWRNNEGHLRSFGYKS